MLGREALVIIEKLSRLIVAKIDEFIFHVQGWINGRIATAVTILYLQMILRARTPSPLQDPEPYWDPALRLGLAQ